MTTPEIKFPFRPSEDSTVGVKNIDKGAEGVFLFNSSPQLGDIPIIYRYLTFETELPPPTSLGPAPNGSAAPEQPDLKNYVSPFTWSKSRKTFITWLSCAVTAVTAYTAGSYGPPSQQMSDYWGLSQTAIYVGITTFTTGFAIAPMLLAPFSELNGRKPVFVASGILFVICQLCCAVTRSYPGMLLARFFVGVGGSTFSTMVGGVVSDIYHTKDRNTPMALFSGAALFGTGLGPLCSGFIAQHISWRWVFYVQVIDCGLLILAVTIFFKETRGSVLLSRRAKLLNSWYEARENIGLVGLEMALDREGKKQSQRIRWKVKSDEERESLGKMVGVSVYRPFHLLLTEPVVFFFSLWVAFSWAVLYLTFSAIPLVFSKNHNFNTQENGAVFAAMCVGSTLSTVLSIYQEKVARHYGKLSSTPEGRLYFACIESALLPIGLFWFGWTSFPSIHWIVPTIAITCATMGIFSIYLAVFNYLADTYHRYASSALAAQSFCRNMLGGIFPLVTTAMFNHMTFAGASSFLGGVGAVLTVVPWVLVFYGPKIRARSKFASEMLE
ncbi:MAG: hypothetical protein ALECFALPRED_002665 [Alectoria fallacina]|uniref:Major facilitator superfamily (MFS) profile domain-containing protein n=1 Tax=Alectoria fallacina TaxID=1903189 RepID=A0A8H3I843_9LECA|nr:MAG: hypothetical protein ALECFALPRED_002665 [Alectoria fallacina]